MLAKYLWRVLILLSLVVVVRGEDAYFLRMNAFGRPLDTSGCVRAQWLDDVLLYNTNPAESSVGIVAATYPIPQPSVPLFIAVPARSSRSLNESVVGVSPASTDRIGVLHLNLPPGVIATSRMLFYSAQNQPLPAGCPVVFSPPAFGAVAGSSTTLPIRHGFAAPNAAQIHVGADLAGISARISVVIYNGSNSAARASVAVERGCGGLTDSRVVDVDPQSVLQVMGLSTDDDRPCGFGNPAELRRNVIVTVDQPSMSWVTMTQQGAQFAPLIGSAQP
jgi:hypothetical protein